jgi:hypothetical protein
MGQVLLFPKVLAFLFTQGSILVALIAMMPIALAISKKWDIASTSRQQLKLE